VTRKYLPWTSVLLNASGGRALNNVLRFYEGMLETDPTMQGGLVSGVDFYYEKPGLPLAYLLRRMPLLSRALHMADVWTLHRHRAQSNRLGVRVEVTEAQAEPWGRFKAPGNSLAGFEFMLRTCLDDILDLRQNSMIRLWGIEWLARGLLDGSLTPEQKKIVGLITEIASRNQ
jgi:hypothetical protein